MFAFDKCWSRFNTKALHLQIILSDTAHDCGYNMKQLFSDTDSIPRAVHRDCLSLESSIHFHLQYAFPEDFSIASGIQRHVEQEEDFTKNIANSINENTTKGQN